MYAIHVYMCGVDSLHVLRCIHSTAGGHSQPPLRKNVGCLGLWLPIHSPVITVQNSAQLTIEGLALGVIIFTLGGLITYDVSPTVSFEEFVMSERISTALQVCRYK